MIMRQWIFIFSLLLGSCSQNFMTLAKVNGDSISVGDLKLRLHEVQFDPNLIAESDVLNLKKTILNEMIEEKILQQEARELSIEVSPEEIQSSIHVENLDQVLAAQNMSKQYWEERTRQKILNEKVFQKVAESTPQPQEKEISDFYASNTEQFHQKIQIHIQQIVLNDKAKAQEIQKLLLQGEDFSSAAKKNSVSIEASQGGDLGFITNGQLPEAFEKKVFAMKVGSLSPILESEGRFFLVKMLEKKDEKQLSLEEARPTIQTMLWQKARDRVYGQWLQDKIIHADIKRNYELLQEKIYP